MQIIGKSKIYIRLILLALFFSAVTSCAHYDDYYGHDGAYYYDPYDYHYYPSIGVYFHVYSGDYYHYHKRAWVKGRKLPSNIRIDPRDRVRVRVDSGRPYSRSKEHRRAYKPRKDYRRDTKLDRKERSYNSGRYEQNRKKKKR